MHGPCQAFSWIGNRFCGLGMLGTDYCDIGDKLCAQLFCRLGSCVVGWGVVTVLWAGELWGSVDIGDNNLES